MAPNTADIIELRDIGLVMQRHLYPNNKRFAFTVFDDTDGASVENVGEIYSLLHTLNMRTTKSVWTRRSRGAFDGQSLNDDLYLDWVRALQKQGFEIGIHNVGDGDFNRAEILAGLKEFENALGANPRIHTNHVSNPDNLYWWHRRFGFPLNGLYYLWRGVRGVSTSCGGEVEGGPYFWGDYASKNIDYVRNLTFSGINTIKHDPLMPYRQRSKKHVKAWFSSSDGHDINVARSLLTKKNIDRLESEGGACILYTHFASGFQTLDGEVDPSFRQAMEYMASKGTGWFPTVSELLDFLKAQNGIQELKQLQRLKMEARWVIDRAKKYFLYKM